MKTPDFAYPKTVETDSRKELNEALKSDRPVDALRAFMNLTIATSQISREESIALLGELDTLCLSLRAPYNAIGYLLEAQIYREIYDSDRWSFDKRTVPYEMKESNPLLWDRSLFASKIQSLLLLALSEKKEASTIPLKYIGSLIDKSDWDSSYTIYDFIVYKAINISDAFSDGETIPFYKTSGRIIDPRNLIDDLLNLHTSPSEARTTAIMHMADLMTNAQKKAYLWNQIRLSGTSDETVPLILNFYNSFGSRLNQKDSFPSLEEFYDFIKTMRKIISNGHSKKDLSAILEAMRQEEVNLNFPSVCRTEKKIDIRVSASNLKEFYIILLDLKEASENRFTIPELSTKCSVITYRKVTLDRDIPFQEDTTLSFKAGKPGLYTFIASRSPKPSDIINNGRYFYATTFRVSDIDAFSINRMVIPAFSDSISDNITNFKSGCFVVEASDGTPIEGATVRFEEQVNYWDRQNGKQRIVKIETDGEGFAASPVKDAHAFVEFNGNKAFTAVNNYSATHPTANLHIRLLADRAVYRPGDKIRFFGISYITDQNEGFLKTGCKVRISLENPNNEEVDSLLLTTDSSGRIFGEFIIPTDGLLGTWTLLPFNIPNKYKKEETIKIATDGELCFEVAEYKTPTLFVTLEKTKAENDSVAFKGFVSTYSGMPLADTKVEFIVKYEKLWFFYDGKNDNLSYSSTVTTDSKGEFRISLPLSNLDPQEYRGIFIINASATDGTGETATSPAVMFWLRDYYRICPAIPEKACIDNAASRDFSVPVYDMAGQPCIKTIEFTIRDSDDKVVAKGEFESPKFVLPDLPSGKYTIDFKLNDEERSCTEKVILYRETDRTPPVATALWVPRTQYEIPTGQQTIEVKYGSSYKGQNILCIISDSNGDVEYFWIISEGINSTLKVKSPGKEERKYITFVGFRDHEFLSNTITLIPCAQNERLEIKTETFRSSIEPGSEEEWKFTTTYGDKTTDAFAYALLYDKAMDAICQLHWNTTLLTRFWPIRLRISGNSVTGLSDSFRGQYISIPYYGQKDFNLETYGYSLYNYHYGNHLRLMKASRSIDNMMISEDAEVFDKAEALPTMSMNFSAETGIAEEETISDDEIELAGASGLSENTTEMEFRPIEMPVAFFKPDLGTDNDGRLTIKFTVPNFNTTWNFLLGAYTSALASDCISQQTVASKKVMVKMHAPRFIRTGDQATLTATIFNNSNDNREIFGEFEIYNPVTGVTLKKTESTPEIIAPSCNRIISVDFDCPYDINSIGLRVYARGTDTSDGEQTVIPVLPSSQPIVESSPFYIPVGEKECKMKVTIPQSAGKDLSPSVTFKYCDNPIWEVVTALTPIIEPKSESLTSLMAALYADCVGKGLIENNPSLREGLKLITKGEAGDEILTSSLVKDADLKTVTLNNTPWVNDARSEDLRLSRLKTLLDTKTADETIERIWNKIVTLRNPDGGWSWCPGMKSSRWMTEIFLINIALLKGGGYLPVLPEAEDLTDCAIRFVESEYVKEYNEISGDKSWFYMSMLPYLYCRSFFTTVGQPSSFEKIRRNAIKYIDSNWETLSIFNKATAAVMLFREGKRMTAREILESLRQFTSESREKGAWFDNLDSDWRGAGKLLTTARVLTAFNEIQPGDSLIDKMRQWMLLQRQTQDWQEGLWSIDGIDALLSTGTTWSGEYEIPSIKIAGKTVPVNDIARLTGSVTLNMDLKSTGINPVITISRFSPAPAWGGVVSQYIMPMQNVKQASVTDLSIQKEYWKIIAGEDGEKAVKTSSLSVGDRVRVTLIVDCGRDMDFVALTDQRAACLEPADQLSGYTVRDGLWCYSETRNSATNLFFNFLPRGRHIISYECRVMEAGEFASGVATLQCQYSPLLTAHSSGEIIRVN